MFKKITFFPGRPLCPEIPKIPSGPWIFNIKVNKLLKKILDETFK